MRSAAAALVDPVTVTPQQLRAGAQRLTDELDRNSGPSEETGTILGRVPSSKGDIRFSWQPGDDYYPPALAIRVWNDRGYHPRPIPGLGVTIPMWHLHELAKAVATALELAAEEQRLRNLHGVGPDARRR